MFLMLTRVWGWGETSLQVQRLLEVGGLAINLQMILVQILHFTQRTRRMLNLIDLKGFYLIKGLIRRIILYYM